MRAVKLIDVPPVWLAGFLVLAWIVGRVYPITGLNSTGLALTGLGLVLLFVSLAQMVFARTTFIPRKEPDALVTTGLFARSRNPIYLGDALILSGMALYWDAVLALPMVAVFVWIISQRFIVGEEKALRRKFGPAFDEYCARTRRWM